MNRTAILLCSITCTALSTGCRRIEHSTPAALPSVRLTKAETSPVDSGARYSVALLPCKQTDLAFKSGGIVETIRQMRGADGQMRSITMGDPVSNGEELARVRTSEYRDQLNQAKAQLEQNQGQLKSAEANQQLAERNFERASALYESASLTKQDYDRSVQQRDSANASVTSTRAGISNAEAQIAQANTSLNDTAVRSPFAGSVVERKVELGMLVGSSAPAFTIADISCVKANFTVPDTALPEVSLGRKLAIHLDRLQRQVIGSVTGVSATADPQSRVFTVELTAPNADRTLRPGMVGDVRLTSPQAVAPRLMVPLSALVQGPGGGFAVFVSKKEINVDRVHRAPVVIGSTSGTNVQILSGLLPGDEVVSVGAQTLHDGDAVRVLE